METERDEERKSKRRKKTGRKRLLKICSSLYIQGVLYIWGHLINPCVNYCVTVAIEIGHAC